MKFLLSEFNSGIRCCKILLLFLIWKCQFLDCVTAIEWKQFLWFRLKTLQWQYSLFCRAHVFQIFKTIIVLIHVFAKVLTMLLCCFFDNVSCFGFLCYMQMLFVFFSPHSLPGVTFLGRINVGINEKIRFKR